MSECPDCANPAMEYRVGDQCAYCALVTGNNSSLTRQALAVSIAPEVFQKLADSCLYFTHVQPKRGRKFGPWEERAVIAAYEAADRVAVLVGWDVR
jgi:hypothetical protein